MYRSMVGWIPQRVFAKFYFYLEFQKNISNDMNVSSNMIGRSFHEFGVKYIAKLWKIGVLNTVDQAGKNVFQV